MTKTIQTVQEIVDDCKLFGKTACGWVEADPSQVPHALKVLHPQVREWVQKVYVYPRKGAPAVRVSYYVGA